MDIRPLPHQSIPEKLQRHVGPDAPAPLKMMGARGMVPAAPAELATLLYQLSFDDDDAVSSAAKKALDEMPPDVRLPAAQSLRHGSVLHRLARAFRYDDALVEQILTNAATADETYVEIAKNCSESISELVAANEVRILRTPAIIESLYMNENARTSTFDRLINLARRNNVEFGGLTILKELVEDERYDPTEHADQAEERDAKFKKQLEESKRLEEEEKRRASRGVDDDDSEEDEPEENQKSKSRLAEIQQMSISEKCRLATLGARGDRLILIRDPNRLIHMAAVMSPKVQEKDILGYAGNKQAADGVLNYIANHSRYRRNYKIVSSLVNNPKTPLSASSNLIQSLQKRDLVNLARNRNIPIPLRKMAKRLKEQREKGRRG